MYRIVSARTGLIVSTLFVCVGIASRDRKSVV